MRAANLTAALTIARLHGATLLGVYGACVALVTAVVMFADNGLQLSAITEIGRSGAPSMISDFYLSKAILCAFGVMFLYAIGVEKGFPHIYWVIGGLVTLRTLIQSYSQLQSAILKSLFRMHVIGMVQALHAGILFLGIAIAFVRHWSITALLALLVGGQTLELLLMSAAVCRIRIRLRWPIFSSCLALMRRSVPLGLGYALANHIVRLDVVVLALVVPLPEVGQFSAADNLLVIGYLAAWLLGCAFARDGEALRFHRSPEPARESLDSSCLQARRSGCSTRLSDCAASDYYALRPGFGYAGVLASWMVLAYPLIVFNSLSLHHIIATRAKRAYLNIMFVTALSAVVLDYVFAQYFGSIGVVAAILIRESLLSVVLWLRHVRVRDASVKTGISVAS